MKILEFFGEPLSYGGQESFIINMYTYFSEKNEYTFCTPFHVYNVELCELVKKKGDNIIAYNYKFDSSRRKGYIYNSASRMITDKYDIIHIHSGSVWTLLAVAYLAKKKGVGHVIVHSHATGYDSLSHKVIKLISNRFIGKYADLFMACSYEAGLFKFPMKIIESEKFIRIMNGIQLNKYRFNINMRNEVRANLGLNDKFVICHVGRFSPEKNHIFIIDIFIEYLKKDSNALLLLIGADGKMEEIVKRKIRERGIGNKVIILKNRADVNRLLNAADVFVFPSLFEGLGISAIEAQAAGLPTICGNNLPKELNASNNYYSLKLEDNSKEWADTIYKLKNYKRIDCSEQLRKNGYDIEDCSKKLEKIYEKVRENDVI